MTKQRELVHKILYEYGHLTAEQIFTLAKQEMPEIAFATIYNNLKRLCDAGIIRRVRVGEGADFYDRNCQPHDHLICERCGKIVDMIPGGLKKTIEHICCSSITRYELNAYYICESCLNGENTQEDAK